MAQSSRREKIEAMLAETPNDVMLRYSLGMEHVSQNDDAAAVQVFRDIITREPYIPAFHMAGQALNRLGRVEEACQMLRDGIAVARKSGDQHALGEMEGLLTTIE